MNVEFSSYSVGILFIPARAMALLSGSQNSSLAENGFEVGLLEIDFHFVIPIGLGRFLLGT